MEILPDFFFLPMQFKALNSNEVFKQDKKIGEISVELSQAKESVGKLPDSRNKCLVFFYYSELLEKLPLFISVEQKPIHLFELVSVDGKSVSGPEIRYLYDLYEDELKNENNRYDKERGYISQDYYNNRQASHHKILANFFVYPLLKYLVSMDSFYLNTHFLISSDFTGVSEKIVFDFSILFSFRFRVGIDYPGEDFLITQITRELGSLSDFIKGLASVKTPYLEDIRILYGINDLTPKNPERNFSKQKRETILRIIEERSKNRFIYFNDLKSLVDLFKKGSEGKVIILLTHFHEKEDTGNYYFYTFNPGISFKRFLKKLSNLKEDDLLRDDIVLDTSCCTSYGIFHEVYKLGIKYIYQTHVDIDFDLNISMIYELVTGENAEKACLGLPYLNGSTYLHEAWSNVLKCFFKMSHLKKKITTPE